MTVVTTQELVQGELQTLLSLSGEIPLVLEGDAFSDPGIGRLITAGYIQFVHDLYSVELLVLRSFSIECPGQVCETYSKNTRIELGYRYSTDRHIPYIQRNTDTHQHAEWWMSWWERHYDRYR